MFSHINANWSLGRKMWLITFTAFVPIAVAVGPMIGAKWQEIGMARSESKGIELQNAVWRQLLSEPQGALSAASRPELRDIMGSMAVQAEYEAFVSAANPVERARLARELLHRIARTSGLALDSDPASSQLIHVSSLQLASIYQTFAGITARSSAGDSTSADGRLNISLAVLQHQVSDMLDTFVELTKTPEGAILAPKLDQHTNLYRDFLVTVRMLQEQPETSAKVAPLIARLAGETAAFQKQASSLLNELIQTRISDAWLSIAGYVSAILGTVLMVCFLSFRIARDLTGSLHQQLDTINRISREDENAEILYVDHQNESGELAKALQVLKAGVIERKRSAEEAKRQIEEKVATNDFYVKEHERFMAAFHKASEKLGSGELDHRMTEKVIDEYAPIIDEMNRTFEKLEHIQRHIRASDTQRDAVIVAFGQSLSRLAAGDLRTRLDISVSEQFERLKSDFNSAVEQLEAAVSEVNGGADAIQLGTNEIAQTADDLSRRTESQAASLEQTATAVEEITGAVRKTAEGARQAHNVVSGAKDDAERSGEVVRRAIDAMSAIENSSRQISQIIGVIDEIAFQTNLLALNAGVEAARAGDAGRGFAVVASEVRALAQRSAEAAKEIKGLISASTSQVSHGVDLVDETGKALSRIVEKIAQINSVVAEIATSAHEQATGLGQVNSAVNQMDQATQQNAAMAEEATAATRNLQRQTQALAQLVARFQTHRQKAPAQEVIRLTAGPSRGSGDKRTDLRAQSSRHASHQPAAAAAHGANGANGAHKMHAAASASPSWEEF